MDRVPTRRNYTEERSLDREAKDRQNSPRVSPRVLAVADDVVLVDRLDYELSGQDFTINNAATYDQARRLINRMNPDVLLVDAALSDEPAASVCRQVRGRHPEIVIIILAADARQEERLLGFEAGADDYLTAPFDYRELVARMKAKLKRSRRPRKCQTIEVDKFRIDPGCQEAGYAGHELALRPKEFAILAAMASSPGTIWTRTELAREVWWPESVKSLHTVDVHVHGVRAALARHSSHEFIRSVHGVGFCFVPDSPASERR
ncbi:MAG: response regulator transcription factor [Rubrobacteraceae bacterium]